MRKCQKCNKPFKKISEIVTIYKNLPFMEKLPFDFCEGCGKKYLDQNVKKLIEELEMWSRFEHSGEHYLDKIESKDHYIEEKDAKGILGEAPKVICTNPKNGQRYLFKWPKTKQDGFNHGFREVATELIMNRMAEKVALTAASDLGKIEKTAVFVTKSFIDNKRDHLIHGVEIFRKLYDDEQKIDTIQNNRKLQKKFYTMEHIADALKFYYGAAHSMLLNAFYRMILTDAWLGNQDRHSENWGIIEQKNKTDENIIFSPLFDTSRGLFWNHTLVNLHLKFSENQREEQLIKYMNNSQPLISLENNKNADHFELAAFIRDKTPEIFESFLDSLKKVDIFLEMSHFNNIMHEKRLGLICELLEMRRNRLKSLLDG